jgi:tryptophan synthase alpha chain
VSAATAATSTLTDTRLTRAFARAKAAGRPALMPFTTIGWPELGDTERIVPAFIAGGADIIELGVPFSDPIADGPTVQRVNQRALENGVTPAYAIDVARTLRAQGVTAPLLFMGYYNPILNYGLDAYAAACADAGIDGLLVPDLPPEESDPLLDACRAHGLHLIYFLAPTSTPARVDAVVRRANGFIYLIAVTGITGAREQMAAGLGEYAQRARERTDLPLAIGFGISNHEHVKLAAEYVDGVIVASALLNHLSTVPGDQLPAEATRFVESLRGIDTSTSTQG